MAEAQFTVAEFNKQVVEFRQLFGNTEFWAKPAEQRRVAIDALGFAYCFLESSTSPADVQRCADHLQQTIAEYQNREFKLILMGKTKGVA